jgi:hypothetical protein
MGKISKFQNTAPSKRKNRDDIKYIKNINLKY